MRQKRRILSLVVTMCMLLMLFPVMAKPVKAEGVVKRTERLLISAQDVNYMSTDGTEKSACPENSDITDSAEGWQWYLNGNSELGYEPMTLVLDGINLEVNIASPVNACISSNFDKLNVIIKGTNTITCICKETNYSIGFSGYNVNIMGTGELKIISNAQSTLRAGGIWTDNLTVKDATITVTQTNASTTIPSQISYGIRGNNVHIDGATINTFVTGPGNDYGIYAEQELKVSGKSVIRSFGSESALFAPATKFNDDNQVLGKDAAGNYTILGAFNSGKLVEKDNTEAAISDAMVGEACTLTYDGNGNIGGSIPAEETTVIITSNITVLDNTGALERNSDTFIGWNTAADGSGTDYAAGDAINMSDDTTLYAKWEAPAEAYTVTYDGNGNTAGAVPTDGTTYGQDATATVLGNSGGLAKDGYTFACWNTAADGSGTDYTEGNTFTIGSNTTLYAKWQANAAASGTTTKTTKVPKTSDASASWMWLLVIAVVSGGTSVVIYRKKRISN